jgi:hypothetical protein
MIAPAQMAHSANASIAGVRTHRSPADLLMEDMSGTDQTTSSDDASQSASSDDGSPADHSSFASVLRKFFVPASSGAPQGQAGRVQAGQSLQQKADNVDSTLTVPVQPAQPSRNLLPLALPISFRDSSPSPEAVEPPHESVLVTPESLNTTGAAAPALDQHTVQTFLSQRASLPDGAARSSDDASSATVSPKANPKLVLDPPNEPSVSSRIPIKTEPVATVHESSVPLPNLDSLPPVLPKQAADPRTATRTVELAPQEQSAPSADSARRPPANQPASSIQATPPQPESDQLQTEQPQSEQSQTEQLQTGPSQPVQSQTAPSEALAFAVRISPTGPVPQSGDDSAANPPATWSNRSQTSPQPFQKPIPAQDAVQSLNQTSGERGQADASEGQLAKTSATPLPTQIPSPSEPAISIKSEARPAFAPTIQHTEPANAPSTAPSSSSRDFTVRIPDATERGTNVRFVERGSEVHVSVRTGDGELAQMLRSGLSDLSSRLQHGGIQAEMWRPGSNSSHSDSQSAPQNQSSDPKDSGGRRNNSGAQRDGQDQPSENKPRWVEELETSIGEPAAPTGY